MSFFVRKKIKTMQLALNQLAHSLKRTSRLFLIPIICFVALLLTRSFTVEGIEFIVIDAMTVFGIIVSILLCLVAIFWWCECGYGYSDFAILIASVAPLAALVYRLDPLGSGPIPL